MLQNEWTGAARWLVPLGLFATVLLVGVLLRAAALRALDRWSQNTITRADDLIVASIRWPSYVWILILAAIAALHTIDLPGEQADVAARRGLEALLELSITIGAARLLGELTQNSGSDLPPNLAAASTGLLRTIVRAGTLAIGILVILSTLGISIAPILGALGVGGLAAGLALQPTLSNLFAGFQIAVTKQVRVGHRVRLASGEEGYVADIAWRTTTLRTPTNYLVIIPNSKFADSIMTNFNLPDPPVNIVVPLTVAYDSDLRRVELVLLAEARRLVADLPQLVKDFEPVVRFLAFGESGAMFNVVVRAQDFESQFGAWNEIYQRLIECLRREKIEIPFPSRHVYLRGDVPPRV